MRRSVGTASSWSARGSSPPRKRTSRQPARKSREKGRPACGTMISSDAIMCSACGHRLRDETAAEEPSDREGESEIPCPACGTMISSDAIMCYACGHRMASDDDKAKKAPVSVKKVMKKKVI